MSLFKVVQKLIIQDWGMLGFNGKQDNLTF